MKYRRLGKFSLWAIVLFVGTYFLLPLIYPWSPINCEHQDIDLETGRARFTEMRFFIPVSTRYEQTPISEALAISDLEEPVGDWRRVNTLSPRFRHSPHYSFHGALYQAYMMGSHLQNAQFTEDARVHSANSLLQLWRDAGNYRGANVFLFKLSEFDHELVTAEDIDALVNSLKETDDPK